MSVRVRMGLAAVFLIAGVALPWFVISGSGAPWEFQDRAAVVLSKTGNAEVHTSPERPANAGTGTLDATPGLALYPGDEVRVSSLSEVRLRTPAGDLTLGDGARALMREDAVSLARGLLFVEVPEGKTSMRVGAASVGADVLIAPGRYRFTADGKGALFVLVIEGSASTGESEATRGQLLELREGPVVNVNNSPEELKLLAKVDVPADVITGSLASGSALYLNGKLTFVAPDGSFEQPIPPGDGPIVLFARDPAGNVAKKRYRRPKKGMVIEDLSLDDEEDNPGVVDLPDVAPPEEKKPDEGEG